MRVLIVEDEATFARFLKRGLEEEHDAVDLAQDGEDGWHLSQVHDYNLILVDIMLPTMDGLTLCRKVRNRQIETPIILMSLKDKVTDKVTGLNGGADDYRVKPFAFEELVARFRALLRRQEGRLTTPLQVEDLVLDPVSHQVQRNCCPVACTGKEYALLEYLMRYAGEVVTKTQIADHVWDQ